MEHEAQRELRTLPPPAFSVRANETLFLKIGKWMHRYRRLIAMPLIAYGLYVAQFQPDNFLKSAAVVILGEALRVWAAGHLRKNQKLTTGGPYAIIRHPLYLGSFMIAGGFGWVCGSRVLDALIISYFALCYYPAIRYEENELSKKFGGEWEDYVAHVPAFYPTLKLYPASTDSSIGRLIRNREYNAILGIFAAYAYLILFRS